MIQLNDRYHENLTVEQLDAILDDAQAPRRQGEGRSRRSASPPTRSEVKGAITVENPRILTKNYALPGWTIDAYEPPAATRHCAGLSRWSPRRSSTREGRQPPRPRRGFPKGMGSFLNARQVLTTSRSSADEGEPGTITRTGGARPQTAASREPSSSALAPRRPHGLLLRALRARARDPSTPAGRPRGAREGLPGRQGPREGLPARHRDPPGRRGLHLRRETSLLSSLEGLRERLKPPFPAVVGAFRCRPSSTALETLATVPYHHRDGRRQLLSSRASTA